MSLLCSGYSAKLKGLTGIQPVSFTLQDKNGAVRSWPTFLTEVYCFGAPLTAPRESWITIAFDFNVANTVGIAQITRYNEFGQELDHSTLTIGTGKRWVKYKFTESFGQSCTSPLAQHSTGNGTPPSTPPPETGG